MMALTNTDRARLLLAANRALRVIDDAGTTLDREQRARKSFVEAISLDWDPVKVFTAAAIADQLAEMTEGADFEIAVFDVSNAFDVYPDTAALALRLMGWCAQPGGVYTPEIDTRGVSRLEIPEGSVVEVIH